MICSPGTRMDPVTTSCLEVLEIMPVSVDQLAFGPQEMVGREARLPQFFSTGESLIFFSPIILLNLQLFPLLRNQHVGAHKLPRESIFSSQAMFLSIFARSHQIVSITLMSCPLTVQSRCRAIISANPNPRGPQHREVASYFDLWAAAVAVETMCVKQGYAGRAR